MTLLEELQSVPRARRPGTRGPLTDPAIVARAVALYRRWSREDGSLHGAARRGYATVAAQFGVSPWAVRDWVKGRRRAA